ncbi:MAG: M48 family metallopeptidase [Spongiibacteraceae bacterium]
MDFFTEQDQARRSTKLLVTLFIAAVVILILLTNLLLMLALWLLGEQGVGNYVAYQQAVETLNYNPRLGLNAYFSWSRLGLISLGVCGVVGCVIIYKWAQLSGGGKKVAEQLGGQPILPNTDDEKEQRLLNVVEEMALASGMPVPKVYLLKHEVGINAFAAGSTPADAVIGVTRGCVDQFSREQLQGVIAHEFSHILNGDMRLNIRLIAILHGILFIGLIGEVLLRGSLPHRSSSWFGNSSGRRSRDGRVAVLGIALLVIGWLGRFFGNWIKSAVSRQREFLADASAVQFTRNPDGIADALKIIGGYQPAATLTATKASEMSHLFFGQPLSSMNRFFATHPPLQDRILRIQPRWNGDYIFREPIAIEAEERKDTAGAATTFSAVAGVADVVFSQPDIAAAGASGSIIPSALITQAHDPFGAFALMCTLLLSDKQAIIDKQLQYIDLANIPGLSIQAVDMQPTITALDKALRLPLIELSMPALKCMSAEQYKVFCKTLLLLIRADKKFEVFEWCLYQLLRHYLDPEFKKVKLSRPRYKTVTEVSKEFQIVLSLFSYYGDNDSDKINGAFARGANTAGLYTLSLLPQEECRLEGFISAVNILADCYPLIKPRLLKGLADCACFDGNITTLELEMISAIAAVVDSPIPALDQGLIKQA